MRIYWAIFLVSIGNLIVNLSAYKPGESLFLTVNGLIMVFWLVIVFGFCRNRCKSVIRWIPSLYYLTIATNVIICALDINHTYSKGLSANDLFFLLMSNFIYSSTILTQSDAKMALLTQSPVWVVSSLVVLKR